MSVAAGETSVVHTPSGHMPWDGHHPWPRYPAWLAQAPIQRLQSPVEAVTRPVAAAVAATGPHDVASAAQQGRSWGPLRPCFALHGAMKRCEAVLLQQWSPLKGLGVAVVAALQQGGSHGTGKTSSTAGTIDGHACATASVSTTSVQPWAVAGGSANLAQLTAPSESAGAGNSSVPAPTNSGITLSGRLLMRDGQRLRQQSGAAAAPLHVLTAGPPFCRFVRADPAKLAAADGQGSGGGMYQVRQSETRSLTLQPGVWWLSTWERIANQVWQLLQ